MKNTARKEDQARLALAELLIVNWDYGAVDCLVAAGMLLYAEDDARESLLGEAHFEDQDLRWRANGYAEGRRLCVCPSTKNIVSGNQDRHRISGVEGYADLHPHMEFVSGVRKDLKNIHTYKH